MYNSPHVRNTKLCKRIGRIHTILILDHHRDWLHALLVDEETYLNKNRINIRPKTPRVLYRNIR